MAELPIIYTVRLDLTEDVRDEFELWAAGKHIDDLLAAGFLSAMRFRSIHGDPQYMHLYQLPSVELLNTEKYQAVARNDDTPVRLSRGILNHSAALYQQQLAVQPGGASGNHGDGSAAGGGLTHAATVRMDVPEADAAELVRWHAEEHIPLMLEVPGMMNARLCRLTARHPTTPCREPEWISIYELENAGVVRDPAVKAANETDWAKRVHAVTTGVKFNVLERIAPF